MPTPDDPRGPLADPSSAGSTGSRPAQDPQQEAVKTSEGVEFLHAGSGNSLGDGRTAGGSENVGARDALPDTNSDGDDAGKPGHAPAPTAGSKAAADDGQRP